MFQVIFLVFGICLFSDKTSGLVSTNRCRSRPSCCLLSTATDQTETDATSTLQEALEKMNVVMSSDFCQGNPTLKTFWSKVNKHTEIKESSIPGAGLGLFAKKPIKANTIISFYPSHSLGVDSELPFVVSNPDDAAYFETHPSSKSGYLHCTDQPIFNRPSVLGDSEKPLYLDVNPEREIVPGWVSQFINDGATVESNSEQGVLEYYRATKLTKNSIHIPFGPSPIIATVATKKIKKGEEIYTSYGGTYWLGILLDIHGEDGVGITPAIQKEIKETANDLFASMKSVNMLYTNQLDALQSEFDKIVV